MTPIPAATRRLFPHHEFGAQDSDDCPAAEAKPQSKVFDRETANFVIERVLDEGDGEDLRWLVQTFGEKRLGSWFEHHAPRRLDRRSLAFWSVLLSRRAPVHEIRNRLWPE